MRPLLRWALLGTAGSALGAALLPAAPEPEAAVVQPIAARRAPTARQAPPAAAVRDEPLQAELLSRQAAVSRSPWPELDASARRAWVPPAPAVAAAAPPPPSAPPAPPPPFPYQWLGQLQQAGMVQVFLAGPQRTLAVAPGEVLDEHWRVDGLRDGRLQLTWLPTATAVTVASRP